MTFITAAVMTVLCLSISALILMKVHDDRTTVRNRLNHDAAMRATTLLRRDDLPPVHVDPSVAALQVIDPSGRIVSASPTMVSRPPMASFTPPPGVLGAYHTVCQMPGFDDRCMIVSVQRAPRPGGDWMIYAAAPAYPWYVSGQLLTPLLAASALAIALTALGTRRIVITSLKPVEAIRAQLSKITTTDLGHRVPVPQPHDEIHDLARTVNHTLDMLDGAINRERRFTADASHDLRSPVTAIRTQIEEALLHPDDADWPATARTLLAGVERLHVIVADLMELRRLDADAGAPMIPVDLNELIMRELARRLQGKTLVTDCRPALVRGDRGQLHRMLTNLLDNAERHAVSTIRVTLRCENDHAVLTVHDDGSGVPADQREVVFQRFARLAAARAKDAGGSGLGLPIAREIAHHHGGTLTIDDSHQGACFVARIPLLSPPRHHSD
ncbi:HAMP domain-containing histidine kinase [Nonomuraea fuscirosea]|uniref:sensor histidine kinase n=1 Tax=Nonomuraea fuscirosea TaxID=1291556 RepID=UPI002DDC4DBF|nr:HAMP domain-containing sensor histidine kinase [Nonomuraea fuscirosea]WSA48425.1 HAMP domain-containing histidine kinase [Nonomuraea fuscirosea]